MRSCLRVKLGAQQACKLASHISVWFNAFVPLRVNACPEVEEVGLSSRVCHVLFSPRWCPTCKSLYIGKIIVRQCALCICRSMIRTSKILFCLLATHTLLSESLSLCDIVMWSPLHLQRLVHTSLSRTRQLAPSMYTCISGCSSL